MRVRLPRSAISWGEGSSSSCADSLPIIRMWSAQSRISGVSSWFSASIRMRTASDFPEAPGMSRALSLVANSSERRYVMPAAQTLPEIRLRSPSMKALSTLSGKKRGIVGLGGGGDISEISTRDVISPPWFNAECNGNVTRRVPLLKHLVGASVIFIPTGSEQPRQKQAIL